MLLRCNILVPPIPSMCSGYLPIKVSCTCTYNTDSSDKKVCGKYLNKNKQGKSYLLCDYFGAVENGTI